MAHIGVLQHFWCESGGIFETTLADEGHCVEYIKLFDGVPVPSADAYDGWIVMGGPMNVDETDRHSWLLPERRLIAELIAADQPVIGVCLGAQLIARAAGARVYPQRPKEIGLFNIRLTRAADKDPLFRLFDDPHEVLQWHGDTFDLPAGAVQLARSDRFEQQAFRLGRRVYGLQFHLECTAEIVGNLRGACAAELEELPAGDRFEQFDGRLSAALRRQNEVAGEVIRAWVGLL